MKNILLIIVVSTALHAQKIEIKHVIPSVINESSGIIERDGYLWTHNDSGNEPAIYVLKKNGELLKTILFEDHENIDWEDITQDEEHVYIADVGNNFGTRKNLTILKIPFEGFSAQKVEKIKVSYPDQTNFMYDVATPYDSEGLISIEETLVLFSKNRKTKTTELYTVPKTAGEHTLNKIGSLPVGSLITAADYTSDSKLLALTGYTKSGKHYLYTLQPFELKSNINVGFNIKMHILPLKGAQVEAISIIDEKNFWISTEKKNKYVPAIMKVSL